MDEVFFHKERMELCTAIIEGALAHNRFFYLYMEMNPAGHIPMMNTMLGSAKKNDEYINYFSRLFGESEQFLNDRGIDSVPPMTPEEKREFDKQYPDPYRLRWAAWIRKPVINFFKALKGKNHGKG
jgi:hypothetical protein